MSVLAQKNVDMVGNLTYDPNQLIARAYRMSELTKTNFCELTLPPSNRQLFLKCS